MRWNGILLVFTMLQVTSAQNSSDLRILQDYLFNNNSYNKFIIPLQDLNDIMTVHLSFHLHGINSLNEVEERLTTTGHLELNWIDKYLKWDPDTYGNIEYFYLPQYQIWKPDISLQNGFTKLHELGDNFILVKIRHDGTVFWKPFEVFETKCGVNILNFPFDEQACQLIFGSWTTESGDMTFELGADEAELSNFLPNGIWDLKTSTVERLYDVEHRSVITVSLQMKRRPQYYWFNLICPIIFLSILAVFTFVIPIDSGEKMGYSMTVYLAFAVFLTIVNSSLPVNSQTTAYLSGYLIALLVVCTLIVLLTAVQLRFHHQHDAVPNPKYCRCLIIFIRRLQLCFGSSKTRNKVNIIPEPLPMTHTDVGESRSPSDLIMDSETEGHEVKERELTMEQRIGTNEELTWVDVASALDVLFFWVFSILTSALVITFFVVTQSA